MGLIDHSLLLGSTALDLEDAGGVGGLNKPLQATFTAPADAAAVTFKITHCDTAGGTYADLVAYGPVAVKKGQMVQFELPPESKRYLKATPANYNGYLTIGKQTYKAMAEAESLKKAFVQEQAE